MFSREIWGSLGKTWRIGRLGDIGYRALEKSGEGVGKAWGYRGKTWGMRRPGKKKPNHWVKKCDEKWGRGAFATINVKFCEKMTHFYDYSQ